ncbi:5-formyltetrahydrofolate cyclo-ligase [Macleaya cordata]|uniref:5-formyltetrahydrofolate cyclo-ligase n=1 Tax=Macleaya cordata TaxID=56857 RepID=A0A200QNB2_MACCD|nr:5-formyltetrahydrofolate cyclo-ligase [Macleaya cordata]
MTQPCTIATPPSTAAAAAPTLFSRPAILRRARYPIVTMSSGGGGGGDPHLNLDTIFQQKKTLRSKVRKDLKSMTSSQRSQEDTAIQNLVLDSSWFKSSKRLCAYISCAALREVDTSQILSEILSDPAKDQENQTQIRKKLYVPRVEDKNSHMRMFNISTIDDLIPNSMNILEPAPVDADGNQREDALLIHFLLLLLSGLAFDRSGRRLGRGGGYYDTLLRKYQELAMERQWKQPLLVALSYSRQIMDDGVISVTSSDVSVDALVTPDGVIRISSAALERM